MSQSSKYITEHYSRLKYTEIKHLPKFLPSPPNFPEKSPKQYLIKFTPNPVESFERLSHTLNSRFDTLEHSEHIKRSIFQKQGPPPQLPNFDTDDYDLGFGGYESIKRSGHENQVPHEVIRPGFGAQNSIKRYGYESEVPYEEGKKRSGHESQVPYEEIRPGFGAQNSIKRYYESEAPYEEGYYEERKPFYSEIGPPKININPPPPFDRDFSVKRPLNYYMEDPLVLDSGTKKSSNRAMIPHESVKRSHVVVQKENMEFPEKANLVHQIEVLEGDVKKLRDQVGGLESENKRLRDQGKSFEQETNKLKNLERENQRLNDTVVQYRSTITNFGALDQQNRELIEEIEGLRHKVEDYEFHLADNRDLETRLEEEYELKLRAERGNFDKVRRELEQLKGLEEKFFQMQAEKLSLEEEIDKIRVIKITLESQLEKFRISYEEIEEEVTQRVKAEFELRIREMTAHLEAMAKELQEKEFRMRANFDRELLEINTVNRDLQEQLRARDERLKKSSNSDRGIIDMREKMNVMSIEFERERTMRVEMEVKLRNVNEMNMRMKEEIERLRLELQQRSSISPEKERLLEQVVQELEKVNKALRLSQEEKDNLKRELTALKLLENGNQSLKREIDNFHNENNGLNVKMSELIRNLNLLKEENQSLQASQGKKQDLEPLNMQLLEANEEINGLRRELEMASHEKSGLEARIQELINRIQDLEGQSAKIEKGKKSGLDQGKRILEEENHSLKREIDVLQIKCNDLINKLKEYENLTGNLKIEIENLKRDRGEIEFVKRENGDLKFKLNESLKAMGMVRQDFEGLLREKDLMASKLQEFVLVNNNKRGLEEELRSLRNENSQLLNKLREMEKTLIILREKEGSQNVNISNENKKIIEQILLLSEELQAWKDKFQVLEFQSRDYMEKAKRAHMNQLSEEKNKEVNELRIRLEGQLESLKAELRRKDQEIEGLRNELRRKDQEFNGLNAELRRKGPEVDEIKNEVRRKDQELEELRKELPELEGLRGEMRRKDLELEELRKRFPELEGLRGELRRKDLDLEELRKKLPEFDGLKGELRRKDLELEELRKRIAELAGMRLEWTKKTQELDDLRNRLPELEGLKGEMWRKDKELDDLRKRLPELEDLRNLLRRKDQELDDLSKRLPEFEDLKNQLRRKELELSGIMGELSRKDDEIANIRDHVEKAKRSHMNQTNDEKNRIIEDLKSQQEKELRDLSSELDRLRLELRKREAEVEGLRNELRKKDQELEGMRMEIRKRANIPQFSINEADIRAKYEAQMTSLEAKIMTFEMERDQLQGKLEDSLREIRNLKELNGKLEISMESMRNPNLEVLAVLKENELLKSKQFVKN